MTCLEDALPFVRKIEQLAQDANSAIPAVVMVRAFIVPTRRKDSWLDGMLSSLMTEKCGSGLALLFVDSWRFELRLGWLLFFQASFVAFLSIIGLSWLMDGRSISSSNGELFHVLPLRSIFHTRVKKYCIV